MESALLAKFLDFDLSIGSKITWLQTPNSDPSSSPQSAKKKILQFGRVRGQVRIDKGWSRND